jgi:Domain of unknown function (DUF4382)
MNKLYTIALAGMVIIATATGCSKKQQSQFSVHLTSADCTYEQVNVDIREVWIKLDKQNTGWFQLKTNQGVYDILRFQNGMDTLLATGNLPQANIQEIRFVLGTDNSVKVNNVSHPLTIPSEGVSGLRIKTSQALKSDKEHLTIDFDAAASINTDGKDAYKLIPVLSISK